MGLNSKLYTVDIWHKRERPKVYAFAHRTFMFYLDLDEIKKITESFSLIGSHQRRIYDFREEDHIRLTQGSLKDNVIGYAKSQGLDVKVNKVFLLTNLRVVGYVFNPVSFYCCFDEQGRPACVIPEIGNTFGELKYFFLGAQQRTAQVFKEEQVKYYYISPFTNMDEIMEFSVEVPGETFLITIDVLKNGQKYFFSSMKGKALELTSGNIWRMTLAYPFITLKIIILIHWHAFILAVFKRITFHPKEESVELQRDVYRSWRNTSQPIGKPVDKS